MAKPFRFLTSTILTLQFICLPAYCQIPGVDLQGMANNGLGSEYFVGRIEGKPLITVQLIGGVRYPGVYHIPVQTDLTQLFSYAGGTIENSDISDVTVRSQKFDTRSTRTYDIEKSLKSNGSIPVLQDKDTIMMGTRVDNMARTSLWISIISGVAAITLTGLLIANPHR